MIGRLIDLPKIVDTRGNLTVAEQMRHVPFDIARVAGAVVAMLIALARRSSLLSAAPSMWCSTMVAVTRMFIT